MVLNSSANKIKNIRIDSNKVDNNSLFIAIKGDTHDGHDFSASAYNNGCRNFLVSSNHYFFSKDINLSCCYDTKRALLDIAKNYIDKYNPFTIGITGSVGKTTTRNMVYSVLNKKYKTIKNEGNKNNDIGVPLTVFNLDDTVEDLVLEMGMDKAGDLNKLTDIVTPNIGIITNIGLSHIANFKSQDDLFLAKLEIASKMDQDSILIVNGDDKYLNTISYMNKKYKLLKVGFSKDNDLYCTSYKIKDNKTYFRVNDIDVEFVLNTSSKYLIYNALFAIYVGIIKDVNVLDIKDALYEFANEDKRLEIINTSKYTIISDCYNSSLDSIKCAMDFLKNYQNRKVVVLGDIKELGLFTKDVVKSIPAILKDKCDLVIYVGDDIKYASDISEDLNYVYFKEKEDFYKNYSQLINEDDVILVKASNSCNFGEIVDFLKNK